MIYFLCNKCILIPIIDSCCRLEWLGTKLHTADIPIDTISQLMRCLVFSSDHAVNDSLLYFISY